MVEILVVVLIASIVLAVLASVLGSSFEILRTGESRAQLNSNARVALEYITDDISSASYIPLATDRDLNGVPDESPTDFNDAAIWRVAWYDNNVPVVAASYFLSDAWSDRIRTVHDSTVIVSDQEVQNRSFAIPKTLTENGQERVAEYSSLFRLAIPANNKMPYYLALEWDRNGDGEITLADLRNTGTANPDAAGDGFGEIVGYPELVPIGAHKETAVAVQDIFADYRDGSSQRYRLIPIASNITRIKYEYLHEVPVYQSRFNGSEIEIAYQDLNDGSINWVPESSTRTSEMEHRVPMLSHWEMRVIDVADNSSYTDTSTGATYSGMVWRLADQYPEGYDPDKADGSHVNPNTGLGLGVQMGASHTGWNCAAFYNTSTTGGASDNAPIDRLGFVTTGSSGPNALEGGIAAFRPDMSTIQGTSYYNHTTSPTGIGDFGDADGIPDGDGVPDDPVPGWWLPYMRAVKVTIIATPRRVIEDRMAASGQRPKGPKPTTGIASVDSNPNVFYRLDSPVPYGDPDRVVPMKNMRKDYVGVGQDIILTKTVPVDYVYKLEPITDPYSGELGGLRRVDRNYFRGLVALFSDPVDPDTQIRALTPRQKLEEKNP